MIVYCQGRFLPLEQATVPLTDHGFLYGVGLFETFRSWNEGGFFRLDRHLDRLKKGAELLGIRPETLNLADQPSLRITAAELLARNNLSDAAFRYTVSAGDSNTGALPSAPYDSPREFLVIRPIPPEPPGPVTLHLLETPRTPPECRQRIKSFHYFNSLSGHRELQELRPAPGDEGIMLTPDQRLAEGTITNLFVVRNGVLQTPSLDTGILPGLARETVLDLARKAGMAVEETNLHRDDLDSTKAAFVTNAVIGIRPAKAIHERKTDQTCSLDPMHPAIRLLRQGWAHRLDREAR